MFIRKFFPVLLLLLVSCSQNPVHGHRYRVSQNPGGEDFDQDPDFVKKYSRYEKVRSKASQGGSKLPPSDMYQAIPQDKPEVRRASRSVKYVVPGVLDEQDSMVNADGVDLASIKGAKYIRSDDPSTNGKGGTGDAKKKDNTKPHSGFSKGGLVQTKSVTDDIKKKDSAKPGPGNVSSKDPKRVGMPISKKVGTGGAAKTYGAGGGPVPVVDSSWDSFDSDF